MRKHGKWTGWERVKKRRIKFILRIASATFYQAQQTSLCGKPATRKNISSSSKKALTEGRCRWRHDKFLVAMTSELDEEAKKIRPKRKGPTFSHFVRSGESVAVTHNSDLLGVTADWDLRAGFRRRLIFPQNIAVTSLRPDVAICSKSTRHIIMLEFVPWEERMVEAFERKLSKYQTLVEDAQTTDGRLSAFEVGARVFPGQSLWRDSGIFLELKEQKQRRSATGG